MATRLRGELSAYLRQGSYFSIRRPEDARASENPQRSSHVIVDSVWRGIDLSAFECTVNDVEIKKSNRISSTFCGQPLRARASSARDQQRPADQCERSRDHVREDETGDHVRAAPAGEGASVDLGNQAVEFRDVGSVRIG